jgi:hypothetical protein
MLFISSCTNTEQKQEQGTSDVEEIAVTTETPESETKSEEAPLLAKYQDKIKEALFFKLRGRIEGLGEYRFMKSEKIIVEENRFEYFIVTLPIEYVREYKDQVMVLEAATYRKMAAISDDDSMKIYGDFIIDSIYYNSAEKVEQIKIFAEGYYDNTYKSISPYAGPERVFRTDHFSELITVNVHTPKIYPKVQYYLKARIQQLTAVDLSGLSNAELGYLRNEIFARHGHAFKTEKMSSYFAQQDWYKAYVADATPWLNEKEKWNAQYIKSFEK